MKISRPGLFSSAWFAVCVVLFPAAIAISSPQDSLIVRLLKAQNTISAVQGAFAVQMKTLRQEHPTLPPATLDSLEAQLTDKAIATLLLKSLQGRFSTRELTEIVRFMESTAGKAWSREMASIQLDQSMLAGYLGAQIYLTLHRLHPQKFPRDPTQEKRLQDIENTMRRGLR